MRINASSLPYYNVSADGLKAMRDRRTLNKSSSSSHGQASWSPAHLPVFPTQPYVTFTFIRDTRRIDARVRETEFRYECYREGDSFCCCERYTCWTLSKDLAPTRAFMQLWTGRKRAKRENLLRVEQGVPAIVVARCWSISIASADVFDTTHLEVG